MKSYQGTRSIHLAGQAWEIRAKLRQWNKQWGPDLKIQELLLRTNSGNAKDKQ